jgi:hypothetical protein
VGVDVSGGSMGRRDERMNALDVLLLSFAISRSHLDRDASCCGPEQRVVRLPRIDVGPLELRDFSQTARLIDAGTRRVGRRCGPRSPKPSAGAPHRLEVLAPPARQPARPT